MFLPESKAMNMTEKKERQLKSITDRLTLTIGSSSLSSIAIFLGYFLFLDWNVMCCVVDTIIFFTTSDVYSFLSLVDDHTSITNMTNDQ